MIEALFIENADTDTHRKCGSCGQLKPVECFYKDGKDSNGKIRYRRDCRDCYKIARGKEHLKKMKGGK